MLAHVAADFRELTRWDALSGALLDSWSDGPANDFTLLDAEGREPCLAVARWDALTVQPLRTGGGADGDFPGWREAPSRPEVDALAWGTFSDGGLFLAAASPEAVHLLDPGTGRDLRAPLPLGGHAALATVRTASGRCLLVAAGEDDTVSVWRTESAERTLLEREWAGSPASAPISAVIHRSASDATVLVCGNSEGVIHRWDLDTGRALGSPIVLDTLVTGVAVLDHDTGPVLLAAGADERVRRWDWLSGEPAGPPLTGLAVATAVDPDGTPLLALGGEDGHVSVAWGADALAR